MSVKSSLTVMFEAPFWIGVYERFDEGYYEVCKITFGSEPKDYEVYDFLLKNWNSLKFSPPIKSEITEDEKSILNVCNEKSTISYKIKEWEPKHNRR